MIGILQYIQSFLNDNIGVVTFAVGFVAIYLYVRQKKDYKRDVAKLILQEIRYAEQQIRSAQDFSPDATNYPLSCKLLPTNSWYKNIHLFMGDFKQPQIDAISRFYAQIEYIDLVIEEISNYKTSIIEQSISAGGVVQREDILPDRVHLQGILNLLASQRSLPKGGTGQSDEYQQTTGGVKNSQTSPPTTVNVVRQLKANTILREVVSKVGFIYNTSIGGKFGSIAEKRWVLFF